MGEAWHMYSAALSVPMTTANSSGDWSSQYLKSYCPAWVSPPQPDNRYCLQIAGDPSRRVWCSSQLQLATIHFNKVFIATQPVPAIILFVMVSWYSINSLCVEAYGNQVAFQSGLSSISYVFSVIRFQDMLPSRLHCLVPVPHDLWNDAAKRQRVNAGNAHQFCCTTLLLRTNDGTRSASSSKSF